MKHKPREFEMSKQFVKDFLASEKNWSYFWDNIKGKDHFVENMAEISNYDWGGNDGALIQPTSQGDFDFFQGSGVLTKLNGQRDRKVDKKRILVMEDCKIEHLIFMMANLDFQETCHVGEFLSRLRLMDSQKMGFDDQTILPDNLWITEFNINFITVSRVGDAEGLLSSTYFPKKRAKFQSITPAVPDPDLMIAEAAIGFRIIGDLHDRYWTCYVFYDFGSKQLSSDARDEVADSDYGKTARQRKCLEGFLVRQALDLLISETENILQVIAKAVGAKEERSQTLYNPLLTEDDLSEENFFTTMNKNSVFYPWLLEVYGALRDKCAKSRSVAKLWLSAENERQYKSRWSENDQKEFGQDVANKRREVKARCTMLEKMETNFKERIERIKILKESLSSELALRVARKSTLSGELALREARKSTQIARTVNLFAIVTTIYLPLTFSSSIVAIQGFGWSSPAKALLKITLSVAFGTIILLASLAYIRRHFATLRVWAQRSIRQKMSEDSATTKGDRVDSVYNEQQPSWKRWKNRASRLEEMEKRSMLLASNTPDGSGSNWWYWYYMMISVFITVPVQELTFIIHTLHGQKIKDAGPLKKFVRVPLAPIWIMELVFVYVVMLVGTGLIFLVRWMRRKAFWLWTGNDVPEKTQDTRLDQSNTAQAQPGTKEENTNHTLESYREIVLWLKRPAKIMKLRIITDALPSRGKKKPDDTESATSGHRLQASPPAGE
ncbi:hypothetical protein L873DRAFT_1778268 [Choiromyces venosus 120613-1]|uniref:Uncharacterized protein n=1 Tax=Choiromyces venosus 120613-1 TaxID=1336337 RepID=A0A3N4J4W5_9PEZI|nr:hypothetical protein L873DRAFT_1778268 [Choiromyces venosus 120613-1]